MRKGFTLIELLAVLVVLAIIALITIPIVLGVINKTREKSYERSIGNYADIFEKEIVVHKDNNDKLLNDYKLDVEDMYSGNRVECRFSATSNSDEDYSTLINGKLVLRGCKVVKNNTQISKYTYTYDNGKVEKEKTYPVYNKGQEVTVKGEKYWVLNDSLSNSDYVTLLKDRALTTNGNFFDHVNKYTYNYVGYLYTYNNNEFNDDYNPTVGLAYYSSETCGYVNGNWINNNCKTNYDESDIKYHIDRWATAKFTQNELKEVNIEGYGKYRARLITIEELEALGFVKDNNKYVVGESVPAWINDDWYEYWTMSPVDSVNVWVVERKYRSTVKRLTVYIFTGAIRPVINVYKDKIG